MATSRDKLENKVQIYHMYVKRFHMVKSLRQSVQYIRRYSTKYASFLSVSLSYLTFTNECCQLRSYWIEFHEIFTWYRGIIYTVNAHIAVVISHSVLEWQSDKCRVVGNFAPFLPLNWLPWQRPLRNWTKWTGLITFTQIGLPSIWRKIVKIDPVDPEIALLNLKKKEINACKIYSPVGRFAERAKRTRTIRV